MKETVLGDRALIQFTNIYETETVADNSGKNIKMVKREVYKDFSREGKILAVGTGEFSEHLKKGMTVYAMPFGGVEVEKLSSKKYRVVCIPSEDVYLSL